MTHERRLLRSLRATKYAVVAACHFAVSVALAQAPAQVPAAPAVPAVLFQNVRIFDGKGHTVSGPMHVLVRGNLIERITAASIVPEASYTVIDGAGRTLMPGLIDNHWHTMLVRPTPVQLLTGDVGYFNLLAGAEATATLMRGSLRVKRTRAAVSAPSISHACTR